MGMVFRTDRTSCCSFIFKAVTRMLASRLIVVHTSLLLICAAAPLPPWKAATHHGPFDCEKAKPTVIHATLATDIERSIPARLRTRRVVGTHTDCTALRYNARHGAISQHATDTESTQVFKAREPLLSVG